MGLLNPVCNLGQRITLRLFADWRVEGRANVPPMGPLIVVANHRSNVDPSLVSTCLSRPAGFLAKKSLFRGPIVSALLSSYGAFPLNRGATDARAFRWALEQLDAGRAVVLFPEGTRSRSGMKRANTGVARLALKSGATLLPIGITGTERLGTWLRVLNPTGAIAVNIGTPFSLPSIEGRPGKDVLASLTDMIMERIAVLLPPGYRGVYGIKTRAGASAEATREQGVEIGGGPLG